MSTSTIYKAQLLAHFKNPLNKTTGSLAHMQIVTRGANPSCGDDIEIGFTLLDSKISTIQFRGRACSICIASASLMTQSVEGLDIEAANALGEDMKWWLDGKDLQLPVSLQAFEAVRNHNARKKCVMLAWHALLEGLGLEK